MVDSEKNLPLIKPNRPKTDPDIVNNKLLFLMIKDGDDKQRDYVHVKPKFKNKFITDINNSHSRDNPHQHLNNNDKANTKDKD